MREGGMIPRIPDLRAFDRHAWLLPREGFEYVVLLA